MVILGIGIERLFLNIVLFLYNHTLINDNDRLGGIKC